MSERKNVIRVGDTVKIIQPLWVKRVGYKLHFLDLIDEVKDDPRTLEALIVLGIANPLLHRDSYPRAFVEAVARMRVEQRGFGGRERVVVHGPLQYISLQSNQDYIGQHYKVCGKRTAYTGRYRPAHQVGAWDEPPEWVSAEIQDRKGNVILDLGFAEIEACNVERVWKAGTELRTE